jgi:hypothetical protein
MKTLIRRATPEDAAVIAWHRTMIPVRVTHLAVEEAA